MSSSGRVRAWIQKLDRLDGSFIVRYRLFASYPDLTIHITYKGESVGSSPYRLHGKGTKQSLLMIISERLL